MIYEYRVYEVMPGRMADLQARFRDHAMKILQRHGMKIVGFWTPHIGDFSDRLIYMLGFEDVAQRDKAWADVAADPEFGRVVAESEKEGKLIARIHNTLLKPTDFSPL